MKFPSILNRIIIGLIINLSLITFLFLVLLSDMTELEKTNQKLIDHPFTVSNALKDINIGITSIHRTMKDVALSQNDEIRNNGILLVNKHDDRIMELFSIVTERYLGNKQDVSDALTSFENWRPIRSEVIELSKQNQNNEAYQITASKGADYVDLLLNKIKPLEDFAYHKAEEFQNNSLSIFKRTKHKSIVLIAVFIFLILFSSLWIFLGVSNPMKKITLKINKLSEKYPEKISIPKTNNILSVLNYSVNNTENLVHNLEEIVTERTQELLDEKEFTNLALNSQKDTFFVFDPETGKAVRWNNAFTKIVGYSNEEIAKLKVPDSYYDTNELLKADKIIKEAIQSGYGTVQLNLKTKNGEYIPFEYLVTKIKDKKSGKDYFVSIGRDITKRLIQESELEKHRNHLQELVDEQTEEIQAMNEELQSANEELGALNEELTAANEELSASNEELSTTNDDLERTSNKLTKSNKELLEANKDLERFNGLFVDREFRIKELKEKVKELKNKLEEE